MNRSILKTVCFWTLLSIMAMTTPHLPFGATAWASSEATVKISGMTCGGCEGTVTEKVTTSPLLKDKVESCKADAKAGTAKIKFKDGMNISQAELESAVGEALKDTHYAVASPKDKKAAQKKSQ